MPAQSLPLRPLVVDDAGEDASAAPRWGWPELFVALQVLWGLVLFLPGAQTFRIAIRALPYVISGVPLIYYFRRTTREPLPASAPWLLACFLILLLNLFQPTTHLRAGIGQLVFQVTIAAPVFWMSRAVCDPRRLTQVAWVLFASSAVASVVGILQVYYPEQFLPPEFSVLAQTLNPDIVSSLTYTGADGQLITRPPGLGDVPGGAAVSGMLTVVLGMTLGVSQRQSWSVKVLCLAASAIGMTVLFLTHVRSLSLLAAVGVAVCVMLRLRQGRAFDSALGLVGGLFVIGAAYVWAVAVGGDAVSDRFDGLLGEGLIRTFDSSRGVFIRYTFAELLWDRPLGAGLGRWGMMQVLFGDSAMWQAPPIHAEIQPTGWLLDGGVPLLLVATGALIAAFRSAYRLVIAAGDAADLASSLLAVQVTIAALCLTGPVFNTQLGIQFWLIAGAMYGAVGARRG